MEPPSPVLLQALRSLELATASDLRRASRRCRVLAVDLPAFDTVWLDALVSLRQITRFQAKRLEIDAGESLKFGPYTILDHISGGADGSTYLVRKLGEKRRQVLKTFPAVLSSDASFAKRLAALAKAGGQGEHRQVVIPREIVQSDDGRFGVISQFVEGRTARQELVKRGRLPAQEVIPLALLLIAGLQEANSSGVIHGDVRLENVRLSRRGGAVLVAAGIRALTSQCNSILETRSLEVIQSAAPESIGRTSEPQLSGDVYSLGCVLWHLLAGRPPFSCGDAILLLNAHRTKRVPSILDFAPETPVPFADAIMQMTSHDPADRPTDLEKLSRTIRSQSAGRGFVAPSPLPSKTRAKHSWLASAAALALISGVTLGLYQLDAASVLQAASRSQSSSESRPEASTIVPVSEIAKLPAPDVNGVVSLNHPGPYSATDIEIRGPLTIRGNPNQTATILVSDGPIHVRAEDVTIEYINFVRDESRATTELPALLLVESQAFSARSCRFENPKAASVRPPVAVAWRMIDVGDPTGGVVTFANCVSRSLRELIYLRDTVRTVTVENVLCVDAERLASIKASTGFTRMTVDRTTVRDASCILALGSGLPSGRLEVIATDCIFDVGGAEKLHSPADLPVSWRGSGVVISQEGEATPHADQLGDLNTIAHEDGNQTPPVVGITPATITFKGPSTESDHASVARVIGAPRKAGHSFGVDLSTLPVSPKAKVNAAR